MPDMLKIIRFELKDGYKIFVEFNTGENGLIDFRGELENETIPVIRDLLDHEKFKRVKMKYNTLCWDNEIDLAPEYIYDIWKKNHSPNLSF